MFKLNRMDQLSMTNEPTADRDIPFPEFEITSFFSANVHLQAVFDPSMKWHLIENYGPASFVIRKDDSLLFEMDMDEDGVIAWLLSCGDKVTVLEPQSIKEKMRKIASRIASKYEK